MTLVTFVLYMCETVVALDTRLTHAGSFETPEEWPLRDYQPDLPLPDRIWDGVNHLLCGVPAQC